MQTLVLFVSATGAADAVERERIEGVRRVEAHYAKLWNEPPVRSDATGPSSGMVLWEAAETPSRWPAWARRSSEVAASLYAPLGHERVTGSTALESAPLVLLDELRRAPRRMLDLVPPFVFAGLDDETGTLDIFTDALGVGRLFEVRTDHGWVWSNRSVAALLFAGGRAEPDHEAWLESAVADEFFGSSMPYAGVRALDPATHVHWDGRTRARHVSTIDTSATWIPALADGSSVGPLVDAAADDLTRAAASIGRLYTGTPVVDLTGGRDSRLVAAAFLASGTDVVLHTHDAVPGDLETARTLVGLVGHPVEHRTRHVATGGQVAPPRLAAMTSARRWHDYAEGLRPYTYLSSRAPAHLDEVDLVVIGGAGGEAAHGYFYPPALSAKEDLPMHRQLGEFADYIVARQSPAGGATPEARAHVRARVLDVLRRVASRGVRGATMLDHYYVLERLRRWGTTGERLGTISPLLAPSFLTAALALAPEDRSRHLLHRELTRRLMPAWAEVPYFPAEAGSVPMPAARRTAQVVRLGDAVDRDQVEGVLADSDDWGSAFDVSEVHRLWHLSVAGGTNAQQERVLRAALWRGAFTDHVAGLPGGHRRTRAQAVVPQPRQVHAPGGAAERPGTVDVRMRIVLRRVLRHPGVRALAHPAGWHAIRGTVPGRAVRSVVRHLR